MRLGKAGKTFEVAFCNGVSQERFIDALLWNVVTILGRDP
jgi:hypothetical protein